MTVVVETLDEEEELNTAVNRIYPKIKIQKTTIFEPTLQGKKYKDDDESILINYGDT